MRRREVARAFEAEASRVIAERGPVPIKARGGDCRLLQTPSGKIVTHGEVLAGLANKLEVEIAVIDGQRPSMTLCVGCKAPIKVRQSGGRIPSRCLHCKPARIVLEISKAQRDAIHARAAEKGISVKAYLLGLVRADGVRIVERDLH